MDSVTARHLNVNMEKNKLTLAYCMYWEKQTQMTKTKKYSLLYFVMVLTWFSINDGKFISYSCQCFITLTSLAPHCCLLGLLKLNFI